ncbi:Nif3-like dinuclear metal center hexameric protein [bacterium]|nr:Nif3-like dinuclear metal center hexameric protein [bacterium]
MLKRNEIITHLASYLKTDEFNDYCVNGLQVEGSTDIDQIMAGVSISSKLILKAIDMKAKMIIVHHGIFWKGGPHPFHLTGITKNRVKLLLDHDINLLSYHLPLDAHPEIGNNAMLLKKMDLPISEPFSIGFISHFEKPLSPAMLKKRLDKCLPDPCTIFGNTHSNIKTIAVVSGGGASELNNAWLAGADALITGEPSEPAMRSAEEMGMCFYSAGHYNSERLGPSALAEYLEKTFGIKCVFTDVPNPI